MLDKLQADLKESMLARDRVRTDTIKSLKTALMNERIKAGDDLSEDQQISVLQREAKKRKESQDLYEKAGREEQAKAEHKEFEIIQDYLPKQLTDEQLMDEAQAAVAELGITSPQDMGRVMGYLSDRLKGQADNAKLAKIVRELLGGQK